MTFTSNTYSNVERQQQLLGLLASQRRITVLEICEQFSVSEATARRDLEQLADQGLLQRVHGGAIAIHRAAPEHPILIRGQEQAEEKSRIGKAAAALIGDGETVFLGSGTTVLEVARNLLGRRNLTVITNSLPIINTLAGSPEIHVIVLGGMLRESELSFIGHITEQALEEVRADKVIIGTRALDLEQGLTNDYLPETLTDRAILRCGREIIIAADHSKFGCVSTAFLVPIQSVHKIVTDDGTPGEMIAALQEKGILVIAA
jgi:DeoR/GlpR family transcriptional regulator of sugar metabolism